MHLIQIIVKSAKDHFCLKYLIVNNLIYFGAGCWGTGRIGSPVSLSRSLTILPF